MRESDPLSVVPLRVAGLACALPANAVEEILGARRVVLIPGAPPQLPGVVAWRGRAVAVLDFGALLGREPTSSDAFAERTVVISTADGALALPAEEVEAVTTVDPKATRATEHRFARLEVEHAGRVLPVIEPGLIADALLGRTGP
jgi:chemotaxis signal transduction protein